MNYDQILNYLCLVRSKRITRSSLYFKGYIDACTDAGLLSEKERNSLYRIFDVREVW